MFSNMLYSSCKLILGSYWEPTGSSGSPSLGRYQAMASPEVGGGLADWVLSNGDCRTINANMLKNMTTFYPSNHHRLDYSPGSHDRRNRLSLPWDSSSHPAASSKPPIPNPYRRTLNKGFASQERARSSFT